MTDDRNKIYAAAKYLEQKTDVELDQFAIEMVQEGLSEMMSDLLYPINLDNLIKFVAGAFILEYWGNHAAPDMNRDLMAEVSDFLRREIHKIENA